jgi:hypothetical protein
VREWQTTSTARGFEMTTLAAHPLRGLPGPRGGDDRQRQASHLGQLALPDDAGRRRVYAMSG